MAEGSELLTVEVNGRKMTVPDDFGSTLPEFLDALGYETDADDINVYRSRYSDPVKPEGPVIGTEGPFVVSDGDSFSVFDAERGLPIRPGSRGGEGDG